MKEGSIEEYLKQGEYVYQLFSVLVHSGGAAGGHYYAYIKSLDDNNWWHFNDTNVTQLPSESISEEMEKIFGSSSGASEYFSSTTAYMLFYRKCD